MKAPSPAEVMFKAWDLDHNGSLSQAEFRSGWQQIRRATQLQVRLREQFTAVDLNKSGAIEANEYAGLLLVKQAGKSAPLLATFDGNRDGKLQWDEYLKFVGALAPQNERKGTSR
ncbi:MAG: EF-hand domain-containing protein [Thermomonas sp.]